MTVESRIIKTLFYSVGLALAAVFLIGSTLCVRSCAKRFHAHPEPGPTSIEQDAILTIPTIARFHGKEEGTFYDVSTVWQPDGMFCHSCRTLFPDSVTMTCPGCDTTTVKRFVLCFFYDPNQ